MLLQTSLQELFNVYNTRAKQIDTFRQDQNMQLNEAIKEMRDHAKMIILAVNAAVEQQVELINKKSGQTHFSHVLQNKQ
jgi:hypothetical protein